MCQILPGCAMLCEPFLDIAPLRVFLKPVGWDGHAGISAPSSDHSLVSLKTACQAMQMACGLYQVGIQQMCWKKAGRKEEKRGRK